MPECDKDVFRGVRFGWGTAYEFGRTTVQKGAVRFMFEHEARRRCVTHLSSETFQKPVINRREPEKYQ
jgi:hypothetical protein